MELFKKRVYTGFTVLAVLAGVMIILHIITYRQIHKLHKEAELFRTRVEELSLVWGEEFRTLEEAINLQGEELKKDIRESGELIRAGGESRAGDLERNIGRIEELSLAWGEEFQTLGEAINLQGEELKKDIRESGESIRAGGESGAGDLERNIEGIVSDRNERIRTILVEKAVYDYTREGLELFRGRNYLKAHDAFGQALRYQGNNTTLLFYRLYSRYLAVIDEPLTGVEREEILAGIGRLKAAGYRREEYLEFSGEEMEARTGEMEYNITELQRREGRGDL
jgi:predicted GIY-YIG superfamily endonuclease